MHIAQLFLQIWNHKFANDFSLRMWTGGVSDAPKLVLRIDLEYSFGCWETSVPVMENVFETDYFSRFWACNILQLQTWVETLWFSRKLWFKVAIVTQVFQFGLVIRKLWDSGYTTQPPTKEKAPVSALMACTGVETSPGAANAHDLSPKRWRDQFREPWPQIQQSKW